MAKGNLIGGGPQKFRLPSEVHRRHTYTTEGTGSSRGNATDGVERPKPSADRPEPSDPYAVGHGQINGRK